MAHDPNPTPTPTPSLSPWLAIRRGLRHKCPNCGNSNLYRSYLKPIETCQSCHTNLAEIRADDGPAWATILLVGHIIAPVFFVFTADDETTRQLALFTIIALIVTLTLLVLPRMKGLFIGLMLANNLKGDPTQSDDQATSLEKDT